MCSRNHFLIEGFARKGYNLTIVSVDIDKITFPKMYYIHMEKVIIYTMAPKKLI